MNEAAADVIAAVTYGKLPSDYSHANAAGCYLAGLVWYGLLFKESPENLTFTPKEIPADFAAHLRRVAWQIVQENQQPPHPRCQGYVW